MSYLSQEFFVNNRKNLVNLAKAELIVVAANGLMQKTASTEYYFEQDSNFYYLTGIDEPNMILVIDPSKGEEYLVAANQTEKSIVFDGTFNQSEVALRSGITEIFSNQEGWLKLKAALSQVNVVHILEPPEAYLEHYSMYSNPARAYVKNKIQESSDVEFATLRPALADLRVIKQPQEVEAIQSAVNNTIDIFNDINQNINKFEYEYELEARALSLCRSRGLANVPYNSIVASGVNACTLHYTANNSKIDHNKPLLIDLAAQVEHYSADITRTFIPQEKAVEDLFNVVSGLQDAAIDLIKPGLNFIDYERQMMVKYGEALRSLGLISDTLDKNIKQYIPHATSHFLGLDTHDLGEYNQEFKPGMVLTVEPGVYITEKQCGIRIEDDVLVTENGNKVLSAGLPKTLQTLK